MTIFQSIINSIKIGASIIKIKFLNRRIPLYCEWEITDHCNMNCEFCSTWKRDRNILRDLPRDDVIAKIKQLAKMGTKMIHFSGGEPTLREDIGEIIASAKDCGMIVAITTNGSAREDILTNILRADIIRVSIDGPEQFHDRVRNFPGAYRKAIRSVEYLSLAGSFVMITAVFTADTSIEMLKELAIIAKQLGVKLVVNVTGRHLDLKDREAYEWNSAYYKKYLRVLYELKREFGPVIASSEPIPTIIKYGGLEHYGCRAADISISIKAGGHLCLPCTGLSKNLLSGDFRELYYGKEAFESSRKQGLYPECKGCYIKCMASASSLLRFLGIFNIIKTYHS